MQQRELSVNSEFSIENVAASASPVSPTIAVIRARGVLRCAVSTGLDGFAFLDRDGEVSGQDVAVCRALAAAVLGDGQLVEFVTTTADTRFDALRSGVADVLARNITWTFYRDVGPRFDFEFGVPNYLGGQGFMARSRKNIDHAEDMAGRPVCVSPVLRDEARLRNFSDQNALDLGILAADSTAALFEVYENDLCDLWSSDQSVLAILRSRLPNPDEHVILSEVISREPLGPLVRSDDEVWAGVLNLVSWFQIASEEHGLSRANSDDQDHPLLQQADLAGARFGLEPGWGIDVLRSVGNHGEIHSSNLGLETPMQLPRGLNALARDGGLYVAPSFEGSYTDPIPRRPEIAAAVLEAGTLRCGVSQEFKALDTEFCRAVAIALLGSPEDAEIVEFNSEEEALAALSSGEIDMVGGAELTVPNYVAGFRVPAIVHYSRRHGGPRGPAIAHGDAFLAHVVRWASYAPMIAGEHGASSESQDAKNNPHLAYMFGIDGPHVRDFGLRDDAFLSIIQELGNTEEIFARAGITDEQNRSWLQGGLLYPPVFQ